MISATTIASRQIEPQTIRQISTMKPTIQPRMPPRRGVRAWRLTFLAFADVSASLKLRFSATGPWPVRFGVPVGFFMPAFLPGRCCGRFARDHTGRFRAMELH